MPIIEGALATFECNLETTHDAGDHVIVVGRVTKAHHRGGDPLVFHGWKIRTRSKTRPKTLPSFGQKILAGELARKADKGAKRP